MKIKNYDEFNYDIGVGLLVGLEVAFLILVYDFVKLIYLKWINTENIIVTHLDWLFPLIIAILFFLFLEITYKNFVKKKNDS